MLTEHRVAAAVLGTQMRICRQFMQLWSLGDCNQVCFTAFACAFMFVLQATC